MSYCPVYRELRTETAVARGKTKLLSALLSGDLTFSAQMVKHLNDCTLCMSCTQHCPTDTPLPAIMVAARADKLNNLKISFMYRLICRWLLPKRLLFGRMVRLAYWFQKSLGIKTEGTIRHLSFFLFALGKRKHIPQIAPKFLRQSVPEISPPSSNGKRRCTVGYFSGCMTEYVFPDLGKKVIHFLTTNGITVVTPKNQNCCGAPVFLGAGDFDTGRKLADGNVAAFKNLDYVITDCATCASAIKEYSTFLADTDTRHSDYQDLGHRIKNITEFLVDVLQLPASAYTMRPDLKGRKMTWHDPCHLSRYLGVVKQPRQIMQSMPDIDYIEMPNADACCGMAGTFGLKAYDLSKKIADRKAADVKATGADIVVTACPGCRIQLADAVLRHAMPQRVIHIMELFDV